MKLTEYYGNVQVASESDLFPTMQVTSDIYGCVRDFFPTIISRGPDLCNFLCHFLSVEEFHCGAAMEGSRALMYVLWGQRCACCCTNRHLTKEPSDVRNSQRNAVWAFSCFPNMDFFSEYQKICCMAQLRLLCSPFIVYEILNFYHTF